jgi:DNA-binding CsgD family transcriptional regulator
MTISKRCYRKARQNMLVAKKTNDRTLSPKHKRFSRAWPHHEVSRLLDAIECVHAQDHLTTFHLGVFEAIAALVENVELTMDRIPLADGKLESRHTQEGFVTQEQQSLLVKLIPQNPMLPAVSHGARGLMTITDFVTQREFERTGLYNEVWRPYNIRFEWAIPLELRGNVVMVTVNRGSRFLPDEVQKLRLLSPHLAQAHMKAQTLTRLQGLGPEVPRPELLRNLGLTMQEAHVMHWLIQGKRNSEIASILSSKTRTVQKHVQNIFNKLGVETRTAAALLALENCAKRQIALRI